MQPAANGSVGDGALTAVWNQNDDIRSALMTAEKAWAQKDHDRELQLQDVAGQLQAAMAKLNSCEFDRARMQVSDL